MFDENAGVTQIQPPDSPLPGSRQGYGLTVCLLWNRMLIHRKTIRALGDPQRVRLLINPDTRHFCVQGCDKKEPCSFAVPREMAPVYDPFYIHSKFLLGKLYAMMSWNPGHSYRVFGKINTSTQVMDFDLNRFVLVHGDEHLENDDLPEEFLQEYEEEAQEAPAAMPIVEAMPEQPAPSVLDDAQGLAMPAAVSTPPPRFVSHLFDSVRLPGGIDRK